MKLLRNMLILIFAGTIVCATGVAGLVWSIVSFSGPSYKGPLPALTAGEIEIEKDLRKLIDEIAVKIGERSIAHPQKLRQTVAFIENELRSYGYTPEIQTYEWNFLEPHLSAAELHFQRKRNHSLDQFISKRGYPQGDEERALRDRAVRDQSLYYNQIFNAAVSNKIGDLPKQELTNIEVEIKGTKTPEEIIIVGAHYDSVIDCPAANDNGSGVAATLELAKRLKSSNPAKTIKFVFFTNEEYGLGLMGGGSFYYAHECRKKKQNIIGMISLETLGYYSDAEGSQSLLPGMEYFYPNTGNFVAFVGNTSSRGFIDECIKKFRESTKFPSEGIAAPIILVNDVDRSDHSSFWEHGYDGFMLTDTANFRYPHYHQATDKSDKLSFDKYSRVVLGIEKMMINLCKK